MGREPYRLQRWISSSKLEAGQLFSCGRPGRSISATEHVSEDLIDEWAGGLPKGPLVIVSMLGSKPTGDSEFKFYPFRGSGEASQGGRPTFQEWLDQRYGRDRFEVLEFPTVDTKPVPPTILSAIVSTVQRRLTAGSRVVVMDSGGFSRSGAIVRTLGFVAEANRDRHPRVGCLAILVTVGLLAAACERERWRGTAYPDRSSPIVYRNLGEFTNLEDCRANAQQYLRDTGAGERGDYECGKNCRLGPGINPLYICEDTVR